MRTFLSRLLLVGFLGVAVFAVVQLTSGPSGAIVGMTGLDADDLESETFRVEAPARLAIDVAGSYEEAGTPASDTTLAAYGWIVRLDDETVAWQMRAPRPERGTLVAVKDTITLEAGTYTAYFTSFGDPLVRAEPRGESLGDRVRAFLSRGGRTWVGDAGRWRFLVSAVGEAAIDRSPDSLDPPAGVLWDGLAVRDRQHPEGLLHVREAARIGVRAVTEITDGVVADLGSIVRLGDRDTVWTSRGPGAWAGGSLKNRVLTDSVSLAPGLYRVAFETDRSHAYRGWTANPPWFPGNWGLRVTAGTGVAGPLDVADVDLPVVARFACVGPDSEASATFTLAAETDLLVVAVGEITSGTAYDYATLDRRDDDDGDWDGEWTQKEAALSAAGGSDKNKRAVEALSLAPGTYRLRYVTDGSHDCVSGYNNGGEPDDGLWGAALYALDPGLDIAALGVRTTTTPLANVDVDDDTGEAPDLVFPADNLLMAAIDEVGNDEDRAQRFTVSRAGPVRVFAAGEISSSTRYDYAQIVRADGTVVWEMTRANTQAGGGSDFHRQYIGPVRLEPGTYDLRYTSDGSRSFGDFGPDSRVLWGARVYRESAPGPVGGVAPPAPPVPPAPPAVDVDGVLDVAEVQPVLIGGLDGLQERVRYPELARRRGLEGQVVVQFVVDEQGQVVDPEAVRSPDDLLSEAAIQAVLGSRFTPGTQGGRPVRVRFTVPVTFRLR
ncbi:energy transducer TonB [Rubrivirga sp. IMCC45206]|uniref:energy transducer TonB n=1 Tax=Rubrivirga sp. IMCC45206 TaxID=3391614 RepID=UPI0039903933